MKDRIRKFLGFALLGRPHPESLSLVGTRTERFIGPVILLSALSWAAGISLPMMTVTKFLVIPDTYSVLLFIKVMFETGDWLLLALVVVFGLLIPFIKLELMYRVWRRYGIISKKAKVTMDRVEFISRWSMADVFVVAILLVIAKTSGLLADGRVEPGLYFFVASVLGTMLASFMLKRSVEKRSGKGPSVLAD